MCLENCLMIGIMMPVGVSCLSTLSPMNMKKKKKKAGPADANQAPHPSPDACLCFPCHSKPSRPPHVNQNYTTSTGLSLGGRSSPCLPCRTAFSCPSIMSAGDIQAWCDVAFTKGHVRHLCSVCISRTGSRHMGAGIGHYPGPRGDSMLWRFVSRILISLFLWQVLNPGQSQSTSWCQTTETGFDHQSYKRRMMMRMFMFCFKRWTLQCHDALDSGDNAGNISQCCDGLLAPGVCSLQIHGEIRQWLHSGMFCGCLSVQFCPDNSCTKVVLLSMPYNSFSSCKYSSKPTVKIVLWFF